MKWIPTMDGVDHINIYSKGKTEVGRFLTNFFVLEFDLGEEGKFKSIEGYWYWLSTKDERLRRMNGWDAKKLGKALPRYKMGEEYFRKKIAKACWTKLHTAGKYHTLFRDSTLPFAHYYVYGDAAKDAGYKWLVEMWEAFRTYIQQNYYFDFNK